MTIFDGPGQNCMTTSSKSIIWAMCGTEWNIYSLFDTTIFSAFAQQLNSNPAPISSLSFILSLRFDLCASHSPVIQASHRHTHSLSPIVPCLAVMPRRCLGLVNYSFPESLNPLGANNCVSHLSWSNSTISLTDSHRSSPIHASAW